MRKHPDLKEWALYSRGMVAAERRQEMHRHLDEGCGRCRAALDVQRSVVALADADRRLAAPDRVVREMKAMFTLNRPQRDAWLAPLSLDLVFDSALEPAPAGVRGHTGSRQLLLESEDYGLDLQLTPAAGFGLGEITGLLAQTDGEPMGRVPAYVVVNDRVVGQTVSDEQGRFELDSDLAEPAELWLQVAKDKRIVVQLDPVN